MRSVLAAFAASFLSLSALAQAALPPAPIAKKIPVPDTYFGTTVIDPYRWMEAKGPDLLEYLKAQNDRTRAVMDAIPGRAALEARLKELLDTTNVSSGVVLHHGTYFYQKTPPGSTATPETRFQ